MPSDDPTPAPAEPTPPALSAGLLEPWRVIAVGAAGWLVVTALAFMVPSFESWRPVSVAGLGVGLLGTTIFLVQLRAAQRGARGAQTGLTVRAERPSM